MRLFINLKKGFTAFIVRILAGDAERNHLEFQREVRKRKREKAAAIAARAR